MGQSWSGIKKRLEQDLLCESLRGRVKYFITKYRHAHDEEARLAIIIDGEEIIKANWFDYYRNHIPMERKMKKELNIPKREFDKRWQILNDDVNVEIEGKIDRMLGEDGIYPVYTFTKALDFYLHHAIEDSIASVKPEIRMFAVLDRRIGKRRLKKLVGTLEEQPDWLKKFYLVRFEAEDIKFSTQFFSPSLLYIIKVL